MGIFLCKEDSGENKENTNYENNYNIKISKLEENIDKLNSIISNLVIEEKITLKILEDFLQNKLDELNINNKLEKLEKLDELVKKQDDLILNNNKFNNYLESKLKKKSKFF